MYFLLIYINISINNIICMPKEKGYFYALSKHTDIKAMLFEEIIENLMKIDLIFCINDSFTFGKYMI